MKNLYCGQCGAKLEDNDSFCSQCGARVERDEKYLPEVSDTKRKTIYWLRAAVVGIVFGVILLTYIGVNYYEGRTAGKDIVYEKNAELYYADVSNLKKINTSEITEDLYKNSDMEGNTWLVNARTIISGDGTKLFYPEDCSLKEGGYSSFDLYYRDLTKEESEAVKIDSDVTSYKISDTGDMLLYTKGLGYALYRSNLTNKEKLASNVSNYYISENGHNVVYLTADGELFCKYEGYSALKVDNASYIEAVSDDCEDFYYVKDNSLYRKQYEKESVKIASDFDDMYLLTDGKGYFWKGEDGISAFAWGLNIGTYSMYYFDNENVTKVFEFYGSFQGVQTAEDQSILIGVGYIFPEASKEELSVMSYEDFADVTEEDLERIVSPVLYCCIGDTVTTLKLSSMQYQFALNFSGNSCYYIGDVDKEKERGNLYQVVITDNGIQTPILYDTDVSIYWLEFISDTQIVYFKDYVDGIGDFYLNGERVDYDVLTWDIEYSVARDSILYYTDWDSEKRSGILKEYRQSKSVKIADDVNLYKLADEGTIFYLGDYDIDHTDGNLYLYRDDSSVLIDKDVTSIVEFY